MTHKPEKDMAEILQAVTNIVNSEDKSEENLESIENGLEFLLDLVDNIDYANDFIKMGGVTQMLHMLNACAAHSTALALCCDVLGTVSRTTPKGRTR